MTKEEKLKMCRFYGKTTSNTPKQFEEITRLEYAWVNDNSTKQEVDQMIADYHKYYKRVAKAGLELCEELAAYLCMRYGKYFSAEGVLQKLELLYMDY